MLALVEVPDNALQRLEQAQERLRREPGGLQGEG
jgi:hypothetical protein